jgi:hypothetical protein
MRKPASTTIPSLSEDAHRLSTQSGSGQRSYLPLPLPIELAPPPVELGPPAIELEPLLFCHPWECVLLQPGGVLQSRFVFSFDRPGGRSDPPHFVSGPLANPGGRGGAGCGGVV